MKEGPIEAFVEWIEKQKSILKKYINRLVWFLSFEKGRMEVQKKG